MAKKRDTNSVTSGQQLKMTGLSKSNNKLHKVSPTNLETPKEQMEKRSISPRQKGFNPHLATGVYSSLLCSAAMVLSGILDISPSGNPVLVAASIQGEVFIDHIMGDAYM